MHMKSLEELKKEIHDAVREKKKQGYNNYDIIMAYEKGEAGRTIHDFVNRSDVGFDRLLEVLVDIINEEKGNQ